MRLIHVRYLAIITTLLISQGFWACDFFNSQTNLDIKKIIVATDATLIPMSFIDDEGKISGFEPDLIRAVSKKIGIEIEIINVEWAGLFGGLLTNKFDAAISSITVLEERMKKMAFSEPYLKSGLTLVVRRDMEGISSLADAKEKNLVVAAQLGTTAYFLLEKIPEINKKGYQHYGHAITDLIKGDVGAVLGESTGTLYYRANETELFQKIKIVGEVMTDEHYGIALRKEDTTLMRSINSALKDLLEDGTLHNLHTKWQLGRAASLKD